MKNGFYREEALFELRFWLQVLGDHSRFIHNSLGPNEITFIQQAGSFINRFDDLLAKARQPLDDQPLLALLNESKQAGEGLRAFKLTMLREHLAGKITTSLPPTFFNHMVNELEEFLRILPYFIRGETPPVVHPLHHHLLWLLDAAGHAGAINDRLDLTEKKLKKKSRHFAKEWDAFYLKAVELTGFLRTNMLQFPALSKFHRDVELEMLIFKHFLRELEEMELKKESLGVLAPLMADHMAREECYYLTKLSETTEVNQPACDPTKPRMEG